MSSYISEYCPHCGIEVEWRTGLFTRNTIGPETERCPGCGREYTTGRKEWAAMSGPERRDYYRRVALWCFVTFLFWVMGLMLAAFFATGAVFEMAQPAALRYSLLISLVGGLLLAGRVYQLSMRRIADSVARESVQQPTPPGQ
jgi:endogenous inhibitor of DNA gyrase (YacG/DUF329 family)